MRVQRKSSHHFGRKVWYEDQRETQFKYIEKKPTIQSQ